MAKATLRMTLDIQAESWPKARPCWQRYLVALLAVGAMLLLRAALNPLLGGHYPLITAFGAVAFAVWFGGCGPGALAAVASFVLMFYFFGASEHQLRIDSSLLAAAAAYAVSTGTIIFFCEGMLRAQRRAEEHSRDLENSRKAFQDSEAYLKSIVEGSPDCIKLLDLETNLLSVNANGRELLELDDPQAYLNKPWLDFWKGKEHELAAAAVAEARAGGIGRFQAHALTFKGAARWWDILIGPRRDADGRVDGLIAISRDISELKRAEDAFRTSEARLNKAFSAETVGVLFFTLDGRLLDANGAFCRMSGYTREELKTMVHWKGLTAPEFFGITERTAAGLAEFGKVHPYEKQMIRKDGSLWWGLFAPIRLSGIDQGAECIEFIIDVTERKNAEAALAKAQAELRSRARTLEETVAERTSKLQETVQELETFSYSIAHDMRAPLRAMQSFSAILEEEFGDVIPPHGKHYLKRIRTSADRLDHLTHDVLDYSRLARGEMRLMPVNIEQLLEQIIESYPNLQGATARIDIQKPLPAVEANPAALTQVFSNLLGNAVKFVSPGTSPNVRVWAQRNADSKKPESEQNDQPTIRIWIEDNGIGIRKESLDRVFGIFQRLNDTAKFEGTGIGLAIVKKAVERMGGTVGVESEPGKGSRFWLELREAK